MSKFKVGDRVRTLVDECDIKKGTIGTVDENNSDCPYVKFAGQRHRTAYDEADLAFAHKSLDNLAVDDVVVDEYGEEFTVGSVHDRIIDLIDKDGHFSHTHTVKQMRDADYTVKQDTPEDETVEVTLEEVAKLKGIDVSKLRIKE